MWWGILFFVFNSIYLDALQQIVLNSEFWCVALDLSALHPWCLLLQLLGCNVFKCTECNCIALHPLCFLQCTMYMYMMHCIALHPRCIHDVYSSNYWDEMYSNVLNVIALHRIHYVFSNVQCSCTWCIALHPRCIHDVYSSNYWDAAPPSISSTPPAMATTHPPLDIVERHTFSFHTFMPRPLSTIPKHPKKILNFVCHLASAQKLYLQDKVNTNSAKL